MPLAARDLQRVVWAALEDGDLEALRKLSETNVDWNKTHPSEGSTPLIKAICRLAQKRKRKYLDIIEWLIRQGADPTYTLPDVSNCSVRLSAAEKISLAGHSAFSSITALMKTHKKLEVPSLSKLLRKARRLMTSASVASMSSQRDQVRVDKSVVDLWERILESTASHDVAFQTAGKPVTAHSLVLLEASPVLKAMLHSPMREGGTRQIEVRDTSSSAVQLFLETLYTCSSRLEPTCQDVLAALDLAHRWQVNGVVVILSEVLEDMISDDDFLAIAEAAVLKDLTRLKESCRSFGEASQSVQDRLKTEEFPQCVLDLFAQNGPPSIANDKKRRWF